MSVYGTVAADGTVVPGSVQKAPAPRPTVGQLIEQAEAEERARRQRAALAEIAEREQRAAETRERARKASLARVERLREEQSAQVQAAVERKGLVPAALFERGRQEWIDARTLRVDRYVDNDGYQRSLAPTRAAGMAREFDLDALGSLIVSRREDGGCWVVDGQHRLEALRLMGWGAENVPCIVYEGLTRQQEARMFWLLNGQRRGLSPQALFISRVRAHDAEALAIVRVVESLDLRVGLSVGRHTTGVVRAVTALQSLYAQLGAKGLERVLATLRDAWASDPLAYHADLVRGMGGFLSRYGELADQQRLVARLKVVPPSGVLRDSVALGRVLAGARWKGVAQAVLAVYNRGLRDANKLPMWEG